MSETVDNFSDKGVFSILNLRSGESTPYYVDSSCCIYKAETKELEWIITDIETDVLVLRENVKFIMLLMEKPLSQELITQSYTRALVRQVFDQILLSHG